MGYSPREFRRLVKMLNPGIQIPFPEGHKHRACAVYIHQTTPDEVNAAGGLVKLTEIPSPAFVSSIPKRDFFSAEGFNRGWQNALRMLRTKGVIPDSKLGLAMRLFPGLSW